jgi:hypothetical protein
VLKLWGDPLDIIITRAPRPLACRLPASGGKL